jgi:PrtD family type I secretion system ABC transporter
VCKVLFTPSNGSASAPIGARHRHDGFTEVRYPVQGSNALSLETTSAVGEPADSIDAVLTENARRLRAIVGRWRDEDGDRPTALPLAKRSDGDIEPTSEPDPAIAAVEPTQPDTAAVAPPAVAAPRADAPPAVAPVPAAAAPDVAPEPIIAETTAAADVAALQASSVRPSAPAAPVQSTPAPAAPEMPRVRAKRAASPARGSEPSDPTPSPKNAITVGVQSVPSVPHALAPPPVHTLSKRGELWLALMASKRAIYAVGWFSCVINVLMLAGPLFMLQVYDRVMTSGSISTLVALLGLTIAVYGIIGVLELVRSRVITRVGIEIDQRIGDRIFEASMKSALMQTGSPSGALRDLDTLRTFVAGPAPMTFFDVWWAPVYLLVIFATHWTLGLAALVGCAMLLFTAWLSDTRSRAPLMESQRTAVRGMEMAETGQRNAETIAAMGMIGSYRQRWQKINQDALSWQVYASDVLGTISSASKTLRLLLQSGMLAIGAALALKGEISSGAIIAATIIFGRALAPVEQVITHWRSSLKAQDAYKKLEALLQAVPATKRNVAMPTPKGHIVVSGLRVAAPGGKQLILSNINFEVKPGEMLAIIGPSASGKSSLSRALVGLWPPVGGSITLDGVELNRWDSEALGRHIGYLPQDMELFSGTVRENIGRFREDATDDEIITAATAAHAHELVMSLPNGYATELGAFGTHLSGGQRQRIALARALFGNPAIVVLDEANANLDRAGDVALAQAIDGMRKRGQAIVFVSHRVQAIQQADTLLYIERGAQKAFGPREAVLKAINGQNPAQATPQQTSPPAREGAAAT